MEILGTGLVILRQLASLSLDQHLVFFLGAHALINPILLLPVEDVSVLFLIIHHSLPVRLLEIGLLPDLVHVALLSDLSVFFFPLLVDFTHALLFFNTLLGLLANTLNDILALLFLSLSTLHFSALLHLEHILLLIPVLVLSRLELLLALFMLIVQIHLERLLKLSLLHGLVSQHFLLDLVLVA